jgi:hypothetical protein
VWERRQRRSRREGEKGFRVLGGGGAHDFI